MTQQNNIDRSADEVLCTAMDVGEGILRCGGEIHRVEDTISRICYAYHAAHVEVFSISSLVIASIRMPDGGYSSQTRRILDTTNDLHRLSQYNEISREICDGRINLPEAQIRLKQAKRSRPYPAWLSGIGAAFAAGGFALFFGGTILDGLAAAVIGLLIILLGAYRPPYMNAMAHSILRSFVAGVFAELAVHVGFGNNLDKVMIGTIMLLIPGLAIASSARDMLCGDIVTGAVRLLQSLLLAAVIALGYGAAMLLMGGILQ